MWIFLMGDDFWIYFRVQRFLVRQWLHVSSSLRRLCTRILRSILVLLSVLPYTAHCLVLSGTCCASVYGVVEFHVFYVKRWITDPEVDSRLSGHVFRPLVSDSHLFVASPEEDMIWIFWEMTSGIIYVFSTLWFDSGCMCGVCQRGLFEEFHTFYS